MTAPAPIRVLLADDHPMFREGLRFTLSGEPDVEVVAEAADGAAAVELSLRLTPDVVVLDLAMPTMSGLEVTHVLCARTPHPRILVLSMSDDDSSVLAAVRAGADGYLVKGADAEQVVSAVRAVHSGHAVFGPALAARMLDFFSRTSAGVDGAPPAAAGLSNREREVLALVADGLSNREIAQALFLSPVTVRNHVSSILAKLQLTNRRQAMLLARADRPGQAPGLPQPPGARTGT